MSMLRAVAHAALLKWPAQTWKQNLFRLKLVLQYPNMLFVKVDVDKARVRAATSLADMRLWAHGAVLVILQLQHPALYS